MSSVPRMRAWMFSSVVSGFVPLNSSLSAPRNDSNMGSIGMKLYFTPSAVAWKRASSRLIAAVYCDGIMTASTRDAPMASTARHSVSAESIPPDRPITAPAKPFLPI